MEYFKLMDAEQLPALINKREGEIKLGELVDTVSSLDQISNSEARFVLLGVPEDIGVRANLGVGGASTVWSLAIKALLNIQSTKLLAGSELLILGSFDFSKLADETDILQLRENTEVVDLAVGSVLEKIYRAGKIPILIGGGHNNAYPLLQSAAVINGYAINCVNLDAHSDYRIAEGRHSGNGFRYARVRGYLDRYAVVGLHENYNSAAIVSEFEEDPGLNCSFYEDIFVRGRLDFDAAITAAIRHVSGRKCGIELDLDCVERVLSSAATPAGISSLDARRYLYRCALELEPAYLHIAEGAVALADGRTDASTGKLIAYLVSDFLKAMLEK